MYDWFMVGVIFLVLCAVANLNKYGWIVGVIGAFVGIFVGSGVGIAAGGDAESGVWLLGSGGFIIGGLLGHQIKGKIDGNTDE